MDFILLSSHSASCQNFSNIMLKKIIEFLQLVSHESAYAIFAYKRGLIRCIETTCICIRSPLIAVDHPYRLQLYTEMESAFVNDSLMNHAFANFRVPILGTLEAVGITLEIQHSFIHFILAVHNERAVLENFLAVWKCKVLVNVHVPNNLAENDLL